MMAASGLSDPSLIGAELTTRAVADARLIAIADPVGEAALRLAGRRCSPTVCTGAGRLLADPEPALTRSRGTFRLSPR